MVVALILLFGFISAYCVGFFMLAAKAQNNTIDNFTAQMMKLQLELSFKKP